MTVLTVGQGQQYSKLSLAIAASHDGDTIYIAAGTYVDDSAIIKTKISIVGVGGMADFVTTKNITNGKAVLVTNTDVSIDHLEFSGAKDSDKNGAGIRYQGGTLTITNSYFHDNQEGILAAADPNGSVIIDRSEFADNGAGDGYSHNIYITDIANFTITNSYVHDAVMGHEIKSRAFNTTIVNDRIFDNNSNASYSIDLPEGGNAKVQGNIIQQGTNSPNNIIVSYGEDPSGIHPNSQLSIGGNTIINQLAVTGAKGIYNHTSIPVQILGNHIFGLSAAHVAMGANVQTANSLVNTAAPALDTSHPWTASPWDHLLSAPVNGGTVNATSGNDLLVGSAKADILNGGAGNDTLIGNGGRDILTGGAGADTFVFGPANPANAVQIADFTHGVDTLQFHAADFGLAPGGLDSAHFVVGMVATDHHSEFVYNSVTHSLLWDSDGVGGAPAVTVATFNSAAPLSASDFVFV